MPIYPNYLGGIGNTNEGSGQVAGVAVGVADASIDGDAVYDHVSIGTGATVSYDLRAAHGSQAVMVQVGASAGNADFGWGAPVGTPSGDTYGRCYLYFDVLPTAAHGYITWTTSGFAVLDGIGLDASAKLVTRNSAGTTTATTTGAACVAGQWMRIEWWRTHGASGVITVRLFLNADADVGAAPSATVASPAASVTVEGGLLFGAIGSVNWPIAGGSAWYDEAVTNATNWTGPASSPAFISSLGRRPIPMIQGPDTDRIMRMSRKA